MSQRIILKIDHLSILLPGMTGVDTVIKTLMKGVTVYDRTYQNEVQVREPVEVHLKHLKPGVKFVDEDDRPAADPYRPAPATRKAKALPRGRNTDNILRLTDSA